MACVSGFQESLLNPCAGLDSRLYPGLDPDLGSGPEYEYSVTQSPPGDYSYVKGWDGGPGFRKPCRKSQIVSMLTRLPGAD